MPAVKPQMGQKREILLPIIMAVPPRDQLLSGREQVLNLRHHARKAASLSAADRGFHLDRFPKTDRGAPLPVHGWHWSLSHKRHYVAGVASRGPVGIDLEKIRPVTPGIFGKVAAEAEWGLGDEPRELLFFRFWTAKEALTKATGVGYSDFSRCRIVAIPDTNTLVAAYRNRRHTVSHLFFDGHIATITAGKPDVNWRIISVAPHPV